MTSKRKPYKTYTKEFKQEAVRMMESGQKPAAELAMELGIRRNQLYKWKEPIKGVVVIYFGAMTGKNERCFGLKGAEG